MLWGMPLHDEIRDELYGPEGGGDEAAASVAVDILEAASYPHSAFKVLAIAAAAEIGLLAMALLGAEVAVSDLEAGVHVMAAIFVTGFLLGFTTFRMFEHSWGTGRPQVGPSSPSILTGNAPRPYSESLWIWFIASAAGFFNIILFYGIIS